jgi:hypothetical protein
VAASAAVEVLRRGLLARHADAGHDEPPGHSDARTEIERNRLVARLAKGTRLEKGETRRGAISRGTALVAALLR